MEAKEAMECHPAVSVVGFQVARVSWKCHFFCPPQVMMMVGVAASGSCKTPWRWHIIPTVVGIGPEFWYQIRLFGTKTAGRFLFLQEDLLKKRIQRVVHHVMLMLMTFLLLKVCYNFGQQREVSSWFQVFFLCTQQESWMNNLTYIAWYRCLEVISYNKLHI